MLEKDNSFTVHHYNIQTLCIELYKVYSNLSQTIFNELFVRNHSNYNLRSQSDFVIPEVKTVYERSNSLRYFGPVIWNLLPKEIKYSDSLDSFIRKIRQWKPNSCSCRLSNTTSLALDLWKKSLSLLMPGGNKGSYIL